MELLVRYGASIQAITEVQHAGPAHMQLLRPEDAITLCFLPSPA